ncbi:hypothetical protein PY254_01865 [Rhodanobacter sp. AS-Z3]|uniref:hypothetical protein n=1 Tax=Rhodanobacter sp. AS-Z3 TaxID=3031330 RepID=UPI00247909B0|nr:hypothetical protein [Rhodanobacter sp. AS-Z3]WEN15447.1 hypothetical protein PY254_01865 [Rhodanobacter sp. AS-Z3]
MYREAAEAINRGLSLGARLLLGSFSALFGIVMMLTAQPTDNAIFFYLIGAFFLLIAVACVTRGRVRQFIGSVVGCVMFALGVWYLVTEFFRCVYWSDSRAQPSALNACLYLAFIGIPGAAYAYRARFGLRGKA